MYGYIYKTTNKVNGLIYVGQKHSSKFLGTVYLGSGKLLRQAIKKEGREQFNVELLDEADSPEELDLKEIYWIDKLQATDKTIGYNICNGGKINRTMCGEHNPFYGKTHSISSKQLMSEKQLASWTPEKRARQSQIAKTIEANFTEEQKLQRSLNHSKAQSGELGGMYGKHHSEKTKELLSQKRKDFLNNLDDSWIDPAQTEEAKEKRKQSLLGHTVSEATREKIRQSLKKRHEQLKDQDND